MSENNNPAEGGQDDKPSAERLRNFGIPAASIFGALLLLYGVSYAVISGIVDGTTQVKYKNEDLIDDALATLSHVRDKNAKYGQLPVTLYPVREGAQGEKKQSANVPRMILLTVPSDLEGSKYVDMAMSCGEADEVKSRFTDAGVIWGGADYHRAEVTLTQQPVIENKQEKFSNVAVKKVDIGGNVLHAFNSVVAKEYPCHVSFADREAEISKFYILTNNDRALLMLSFCAVGFACFVLGGVYPHARRDPTAPGENGAGAHPKPEHDA